MKLLGKIRLAEYSEKDRMAGNLSWGRRYYPSLRSNDQVAEKTDIFGWDTDNHGAYEEHLSPNL